MYVWGRGNGVVLEEGGHRLAIDMPKRVPGATHVVTHAHWDHLGALRQGPGYANTETARILVERGVWAEAAEGLEVGPFSLHFLPAGHIVGSGQVLVENGRSVLVTGDFKLERDLVAGRAETESVDILIMDTTFGVPYFRFPSRKTLYRQLKHFVFSHLREGRSVVLLAYAVGKSQELTALLNTWGIQPYVLPETHAINALFGLRDRILHSVPCKPSVLILPPRFRKVLDAFSLQTGIDHAGLFVSGWNSQLPLSSHADWDQTVKFVEAVSPEVLITYGENAERAAEYLRAEGFNALPLRKPLFL